MNTDEAPSRDYKITDYVDADVLRSPDGRDIVIPAVEVEEEGPGLPHTSLALYFPDGYPHCSAHALLVN